MSIKNVRKNQRFIFNIPVNPHTLGAQKVADEEDLTDSPQYFDAHLLEIPI